MNASYDYGVLKKKEKYSVNFKGRKIKTRIYESTIDLSQKAIKSLKKKSFCIFQFFWGGMARDAD